MLTNYVIPDIAWPELLGLARTAGLHVCPPTPSGTLITGASTVWVRHTQDRRHSWLFSHVDATDILQALARQYYTEHDPEFNQLATEETTLEALAKLENAARLARKRILI